MYRCVFYIVDLARRGFSRQDCSERLPHLFLFKNVIHHNGFVSVVPPTSLKAIHCGARFLMRYRTTAELLSFSWHFSSSCAASEDASKLCGSGRRACTPHGTRCSSDR